MTQPPIQFTFPDRYAVKHFGGENERSFRNIRNCIQRFQEQAIQIVAQGQLNGIVRESGKENALPHSQSRFSESAKAGHGISPARNASLLSYKALATQLAELEEGMGDFLRPSHAAKERIPCTGREVLDYSARSAIGVLAATWRHVRLSSNMRMELGPHADLLQEACMAAAQEIAHMPHVHLGVSVEEVFSHKDPWHVLFSRKNLPYTRQPLNNAQKNSVFDLMRNAAEVIDICDRQPSKFAITRDVMSRVKAIRNGDVVAYPTCGYPNSLGMGQRYAESQTMGYLRNLLLVQQYDALFTPSDYRSMGAMEHQEIGAYLRQGYGSYAAMQRLYAKQDALREYAPSLVYQVGLMRGPVLLENRRKSIDSIPDWVFEMVAETSGAFLEEKNTHTPLPNASMNASLEAATAALKKAEHMRCAPQLTEYQVAALLSMAHQFEHFPLDVRVNAAHCGLHDAVSQLIGFLSDEPMDHPIDYQRLSQRFDDILSKPKNIDDPKRLAVRTFGAEVGTIHPSLFLRAV